MGEVQWGQGQVGSEQWASESLANYRKWLNLDKWNKLAEEAALGGDQRKFQNAVAGLKAAQAKFKGLQGLVSKIGVHSQLLGEQREKLLGGFRTGAEAGIARQLEASGRAAQLRAQRQGLGRGGLGGRAAALGETQLRGAGEASYQQFTTKLGLLQSQFMNQTIQGEFNFINEMTKQEALMKFEEDMIRLREQLQRDRESRMGFLNLAGSIGGFLVSGPIGSAVGGWLGGQFEGGGGGGGTVYGGRSLF